MREYEKALAAEQRHMHKVETAIISLLRDDNTPKSLLEFTKELNRVEPFATIGMISRVLTDMRNKGKLERVKGELKPFGCMVKPENLYKLSGE